MTPAGRTPIVAGNWKMNLLRAEAVQNRWERIGAWDLPTFHQVMETSDGGIYARTFTLFKHALLKK